MNSEVDGLRAQVLDRYASIHAFCRAHPELKRATVYLVLSGRYPGKWSLQAARIRAALGMPSPSVSGEDPLTAAATGARDSPEMPVPGVTREAVAETLQKIRCAHCRRLDRRECMACRDQTEREGKELFIRLFQEK